MMALRITRKKYLLVGVATAVVGLRPNLKIVLQEKKQKEEKPPTEKMITVISKDDTSIFFQRTFEDAIVFGSDLICLLQIYTSHRSPKKQAFYFSLLLCFMYGGHLIRSHSKNIINKIEINQEKKHLVTIHRGLHGEKITIDRKEIKGVLNPQTGMIASEAQISGKTHKFLLETEAEIKRKIDYTVKDYSTAKQIMLGVEPNASNGGKSLLQTLGISK